MTDQTTVSETTDSKQADAASGIGPVEAWLERELLALGDNERAFARTIDQRIADLTAENAGLREQVQAAKAEIERLREALKAAERIFDEENGNEVWRHFDDADYQLVAAALREQPTDTAEGGVR